jgi:hypothetical protein
MGFSPWQRLKTKRISYLTIPLLVMATITEFVILATGWKYQQVVCLPQGMGVTFFGIGPIGATILAVELLKLPLAIWTASRAGWQKGFMLLVGLPLICVLTFQLVKDMAVYEMGVAMTPASQMLEKASAEETKIVQLKGELAGIESKRAEREQKLAEVTSRQAKAKSELEESLKRNETVRQDAISLTDYQKKELSESEMRQSAIIVQFNADTDRITRELADLRARRETELGRATQWNAEDARIENTYKAKLAAYTNRKNAYLKAKEEYDNANVLKRQLMHEPVDPGVPPEREVNTILKPTLIGQLEDQIKAKEAELVSINTKRRERVAQVDADARRLREQFDQRSTTKREDSDRKREELSTALAALVKQGKAETEQIDQQFAAVVQKVDSIHADIDAAQKRAEGYYEAREAAIRKTQVHRIATTVEIVRGLIKGERPASIKLSAKERGDQLTDQISMVRIWVYPVLAFIVAFLPTLMVEIGFSTVFQPDQLRPAHRLGFFGRRMHSLYTRAGRLKILRAERIAGEASSQIAAREQALAEAKAAADQALFEKDVELQSLREARSAAAVEYQERLQREAEASSEQAKTKEAEWVARTKAQEAEWIAKLANMADTLNRTVQEKDALRDLQKSEVERQIQMRQNAWSDRLSLTRQELDEQRTASEAERMALMQEHHKKLMEVTEDCKTQVIQVRRQLADAELSAVEKTAHLTHDLKEALHARDEAESRLKQQSDALSLKLAQLTEDATRQNEKAGRQEKLRLERQQAEFEKTLRQRDEDLEHRLHQREQELTLAFETRLAEEKNKGDQAARLREADLERQLEDRAREMEARQTDKAARQEKQRLERQQVEFEKTQRQRDEDFEHRLNQREQELSLAFDARLMEEKTKLEQAARLRESELQRQLDERAREVDARQTEKAARQEKQRLERQQAEFEKTLRQRDEDFEHRLHQREQELSLASDTRLVEEKTKLEQAARLRESELQRQLDDRAREVDARWKQEVQEREEAAQIRLKQREQHLQAQAEIRMRDAQTQSVEQHRRRESELERQLESQAREADSRLKQEAQQKELAFQARLMQREQELAVRAEGRESELQKQWNSDLRVREEEWQRQTTAQLRATETRLAQEAEEREQLSVAKSRQREEQWQEKMDALMAEMQGQAAAIEPLKATITKLEQERDEAKVIANESARQAQQMEKKLNEASSFLSGWRNGTGNVKKAVGDV